MNGLQTVHGQPVPRFGKPVVSYPTQSADDPTYTLDVSSEATTFQLMDFQSALDASHSPQFLLVNISNYLSNEGKTWIRYTYSKLPGKALVGAVVNSSTLGTAGVYTRQQVATGTAAPSGFNVVDSSVVPRDAQVADLTQTTVASWPVLTGYDRFTQLRALTQHISSAPRTTTEERVAPGTIPEVGFRVTDSSVHPDQNNSERSIKSTTKVDFYPNRVSPEYDAANGGALTVTTNRVVPSGTRARGTITFLANPAEGATLTIRDQMNAALILTFSATGGSNVVVIGPTAADTAANLVAAIAAVDALDVHGSNSGTVVTIESNGVGTDGNAVTLATTSSAIILSGGTLSGGTLAAPVALSADILRSSVEDMDGVHALQTLVRLAEDETWPTLVETQFDRQMAVVITESRQRVDPTTITTGAVINADGSLTVTNRKDIDRAAAWKVSTKIATPKWTAANPLISEESMAYSFPTPFNIFTSQKSNKLAGYNYFPLEARIIPAIKQTYYVQSATKPTVIYDQVITSSACVGINDNVTNVLLDSGSYIIAISTGVVATIAVSASTPTYSQFMYGTVTTLTGTTTWTDGSKTITGSGTKFLTELAVGQKIYPAEPYSYPHNTSGWGWVITAISSNTSLTVAAASVGSNTGVTAYGVDSSTKWPGSQRCIRHNVEPLGWGMLWKVERWLINFPSSPYGY